MRIHFVLISEGSSDNGLIPHLEQMCIDAGVDEVSGVSPDFRRLGETIGSRIEAKIRATLLLEPNANLIFIHRDADSRNPEPRYREISEAICASDCAQPYVPIVPVQETEAWLLLDEQAIKKIAQKPNSRRALHLPAARRVESVANPKERLQRALTLACGMTGRRLERFKKSFPIHRQLLLQQLPIGGALSQVQSWVRLRDDLRRAIETLRET